MEKRVLLAVVLSFVVLYAYQACSSRPEAGRDRRRRWRPTPAAAAHGSGCTTAVRGGSGAGRRTCRGAPRRDAERDIVVENPVRATFTNRGAVLKSWTLKRYLNTPARRSTWCRRRPRGASPVHPAGRRCEECRRRCESGVYKASTGALTSEPLRGRWCSSTGQRRRLGAQGVRLRPGHPYVVGFKATVRQGARRLNATVQFGPALGTGIVERSGSYNPPAQPIFYRAGSVTRVKTSNIQKSPNEEGMFGFAGVDDHYFLTAALPGGERRPRRVPADSACRSRDRRPARTSSSWSARRSHGR